MDLNCALCTTKGTNEEPYRVGLDFVYSTIHSSIQSLRFDSMLTGPIIITPNTVEVNKCIIDRYHIYYIIMVNSHTMVLSTKHVDNYMITK